MPNNWILRVVTLVVLLVFFTPDVAFGRIRWLERNGNPILLNPRRFGQQNPPLINELGAACPGQVCGVLSGSFISTLLANAPECTQQDAADGIIDASRQFDSATQAKMISLAQQLRQAEKNTPPDFTVQPPINRNSVFCQKCPKNPELNGLVQAQDPANNKTAFFDPALGKTVIKGTQANTEPFKGPCSTTSTNSSATAVGSAATNKNVTTDGSAATNKTATTDGSAAVNKTATTDHSADTNKTATSDNSANTNKTATTDSSAIVCKPKKKGSGSSNSSSSSTGSTPNNGTSLLSSNSSGANFGSCSTPQIKFGVGFDGRKETAFEPVDQVSYNHGSADNIGVITNFMCLALTNTCKANQAAKDLCTQAQTAASSATPALSGAQADAFNKAFGLTTNFKAVTPIDNTGKPVGGASNSGSTQPNNGTAALTTVTTGNSSASGANFGSCSAPQIKFAAGLDGRKETAFEPVDLASYNHGSAQNINIITQFMCDALTNTCKANQAAKDLCSQAETAADSATPPKSGTQADVFNKFFGFNTNFKDVTALDDNGQPISGNNAASSTPSSNGNGTTLTTATNSTAASGPNFGSCSTPQIKFAAGLDGRKETAFEAVDQGSYPHGSADNIGVITSFICNELTNTCKANQAAKDLCTQAESAASSATPALSGAQADAFNKAFGLNTNFKAVTPIDNTGNPVKTQ